MLATTTSPNFFGTFSPKWEKKAPQHFVEMLGASAWDETYSQTFSYRWKGEDTLTWGNADEWILIKWLAQRIFAQGQAEEKLNALAQQELNLWAVVFEARIAKLETKYTFRNSNEVKNFLMNHKRVLSVLWDARPVLEEFFGNNISIALEVVCDPETNNAEQLFGYINAGSFSPDEAFERLNAFDDVWFLKQFDLIGGLFNFNLE
jgi:hypothetical protein